MIVWLGTFAVQSSALLALAWLVIRLREPVPARTRETVWYVAIAASFTASLVHAFSPGGFGSLWSISLPWRTVGRAADSMVSPAATAGAPLSEWTTLILGAWLGIAIALVLRYVGSLLFLRHRLARVELPIGCREAKMLRRISDRAGLARTPRLTESDDLGSPIAIGLGASSEICVPTRARHELDEAEFQAMLAHEVAHHVRLDPLRLGVVNLLGLIFFFQPLFRAASRDVHWAAEEQCDEWAAHHTGDRLAMASCLAEVARWLVLAERRLPVPGLMRGRSQLGRRMRSLMDGRGALSEERRGRGIAIATLGLVISPWVFPAVTAASVSQDGVGSTEQIDRNRGAMVEHSPPEIPSQAPPDPSDPPEHATPDEGASRSEHGDHDVGEHGGEHAGDAHGTGRETEEHEGRTPDAGE